MQNCLRERRAARRWSQADVADLLGVSRQTVNAIETGRYDPSLPLAFKIAAVFEQPIESLFFPNEASPSDAEHTQGLAPSAAVDSHLT